MCVHAFELTRLQRSFSMVADDDADDDGTVPPLGPFAIMMAAWPTES